MRPAENWQRATSDALRERDNARAQLAYEQAQRRQWQYDYTAEHREYLDQIEAERDELLAIVKAVEDVLEESEARGPVGMTFNGTPFPAWVSIATVRRALTA